METIEKMATTKNKRHGPIDILPHIQNKTVTMIEACHFLSNPLAPPTTVNFGQLFYVQLRSSQVNGVDYLDLVQHVTCDVWKIYWQNLSSMDVGLKLNDKGSIQEWYRHCETKE